MELDGGSFSLYALFNNIGNVGMVIFSLFQLKKFGKLCTFSQWLDRRFRGNKLINRKSVSVLELLLLVGVTAAFCMLLSGKLAVWSDLGNVNYFGIIFGYPIFFTAMGLLLRVSFLKASDVIAPALAIGLFFSKIACYFEGCCYGLAWDSSFYINPYTGRPEFPVQLLEALCAVLIFALLLIYRMRNRRPGTVFPLYMLLYSVLRFGTEFLREDWPKVIIGLRLYQLYCIVGVLCGVILLFVTLRFGQRITESVELRNRRFLEKKLGASES